jgi:hypothetical protein
MAGPMYLSILAELEVISRLVAGSSYSLWVRSFMSGSMGMAQILSVVRPGLV